MKVREDNVAVDDGRWTTRYSTVDGVEGRGTHAVTSNALPSMPIWRKVAKQILSTAETLATSLLQPTALFGFPARCPLPHAAACFPVNPHNGTRVLGTPGLLPAFWLPCLLPFPAQAAHLVARVY